MGVFSLVKLVNGMKGGYSLDGGAFVPPGLYPSTTSQNAFLVPLVPVSHAKSFLLSLVLSHTCLPTGILHQGSWTT